MDGLTRDYQDFLALLVKHDVRFLVVGGFALGLEFADAYPRRITATFGEVVVPIVDRSSLVVNKRAAGRPQDLADVANLEAEDQP